jgi:hypothetical protein
MTDRRKAIREALLAEGYKIVEQTSDVSDPFAWTIIARKGEYEITVQERSRALART